MFPDETRKRQERLSEHIYTLSKKVLNVEENEHLEIIQKLQMIYKDGFKHSYSDFFPVLLKVFEEGNDYNDEYLLSNLEVIRDILEIDYSNGKNQFADIYVQFTKLCDHLNLQISQMKFFSRTESKLNDANAMVQHTGKELKRAYVELGEANNRAKSLQTELIAVLSIFAAIVTTFSGGFTFLGSVMTSISTVDSYEIVVLMAIICGMVVFNTLFLMMYLVAKITDRNIYARCTTTDCSCEKKCSGFKRIRKRLPYVFYFNVVCMLGIIIDCLVWYYNIQGKI